jgi:hypothetical protein
MFYGGRKEAFSAVGMRRMGAANPAWLHPNDASTLFFLEKWQGASRFVSRFLDVSLAKN